MMRTISLTQVNSMRRGVLLVLLLIAFLVVFIISAKPAHASTLSGDYTLDSSYTDITSMPNEFEPTTFDLYKVGSFVSGPPYAKLDSPYSEMQIGDLPLDMDDSDQIKWTKNWLDYASTLSHYVPEDADSIKLSVDSKGHFSKDGIENGIYLLRGDSMLVKDYPEAGKSSYWWPQPMLVMVLDGDEEIGVKPMCEQICELKVHKVWEKENGQQDKVRPESIQIKVYYDTKDEAGLRYTETLNKDNNWSFQWKTGKGEGDPNKWIVQEVFDRTGKDADKAKNYTVNIGTKFVKSDTGDIEILTITNTYNGNPPPDHNHKTGDSFNLMKYILIMIAALIVAIVALFMRRRDHN